MKLYTTLARVYDLLYQSIMDYDSQARQVHSVLKKHNVKTVLEVGCGSGHLTERLAKLGYQITGVDLAKEMLDIARARDEGIEYVQQDMRALDLGRKYDAVVMLGRSITYMTTNEDAKRAFASFYRHLKKGGILMFDSFDAAKIFGNFKGKFFHEAERDGYHIKRASTSELGLGDTATWLWTAKYTVTKDGKTRHYTDRQKLRAFFKGELELLLEQAGFKVLCFQEKDHLVVSAEKL